MCVFYVQGMLGADLVSFNHFDYVRHFLNACTRLLGLECFPSRVEVNGRYAQRTDTQTE
jgi:trehalose 6-phosphate synthase/phosphatase